MASESPEATESAAPEDDEAWTQGDDPEKPMRGKLAEVLLAAGDGSEVFLMKAGPIKLEAFPVMQLKGVRLTADATAFQEAEYRVVVSQQSPDGEEPVEEMDLNDLSAFERTETETGEPVLLDLYVWVEQVVVEPDPTQEPVAPVLSVDAQNYVGSAWSNVRPVFVLSGLPLEQGYAYAVIIYDERIAVLSKDVYDQAEEGIYTLRFVLLDPMGDIVSSSPKYTLMLDYTQPVLACEVSYTANYTMTISASDGGSGVCALSLDGGQTWMEFADGEQYVLQTEKTATIAAGMIQVRDEAGNIAVSAEDFVLDKIPSGGGGGGASAPKKEHASDGEKTTTAYNALTMEIPQEPMHELTIDDEVLPLYLTLESAAAMDIPVEHVAKFTADMARWYREPVLDEDGNVVEDGDDAPDTLVLTAQMDANLGDVFAYRWNFNGSVARVLNNSGIRYLVLRVGDDIVSLPTEGFTGGTRYTDLKMAGVSTQKFEYALRMNCDLGAETVPPEPNADGVYVDLTSTCDLAMEVAVQGESYVLSSDKSGEMYFYDVYVGPSEMMEQAYGKYASMEDNRP